MQFDAFVFKDLAELVIDRVFRFGEDAHQHGFGQFLEARDDRQAAGEFRDQSKLKEVSGFDARVQAVEDAGVVGSRGRQKAVAVGFGHDVFDADEGAAANEQHVGGVDKAAVADLDRCAFHDF